MKAWWIVLGLVVAAVVTLVIVGTTVTLGEVMQQTAGGIDIRIDGERVFGISAGDMAGWVTLAAALAALALLVLVPLSVLAALLLATLALVAALLAVLLAAALLLSPLWLTGLLLWLALRKRPAVPTASAPGEA